MTLPPVHTPPRRPAPSRRVSVFAAAALAGLVLIGALVAGYTRAVATDQLKALGVIQHETLARALSATLQHHIDPAILSGPGLSAQALRSEPAVRGLRPYLVDPLRGMKVVRIKIYDRRGRTVFSTEEAQIGEDHAGNAGVMKALAGTTSAEMVHKNSFNVSDGVIENRDLLESYVPISAPGGGEVTGVFEVYSDMTDLMQLMDQTQRQVVAGVLVVCGVVLLVLLVMFRRLDFSLQLEETSAARYLRQVQDARDQLEDKVAERTRELALSEQRFQDVADAAGEYIWETDSQGRFTFVSDRVTAVLGFTPKELVGRTPLELAPQEDAARVRAHFAHAGGDAPFTELEHRSRARDGRTLWLSVSAVPVFDDRGGFRGHRGAAHDITARKEAEEKLRKMSLAIEQSSEIVIITDTAGVIEYVNHAFTRVYGYAQDEVIGRTPAVIRSEETRAELFAQLWRSIRAGETWRGELCNQTRDGRRYWNLVSIFPLRDAAGHITHYVGLQTDISRRKQDEQALLASEARLRAVMDSVTDAIIASDADGIIEMVNPAAGKLFGYEPAQMLGMDLRALMPSPYREQHADYMQRYLATGEARIIGVGGREVTGLRKDGSEVPLELAVGEISTGQERRFVGVLRDLTDVKRAQRELERARQQYFHREKIAAMGQLAAGIVHEVSNPVAAITGALGVLRQRTGADGNDGVVAQHLTLIAEQADRLAAMTREISDFARPRETRRGLLDLNQVVRAAASIMRFDPRVQDAQLSLELDPQLPALTASQDQLTQVVLNLVLNAADASQDKACGGRRITVRTTREDASAVLTVSDEGIGMDEQTMRRALEPYFTTKGEAQGMGLGLSLCQDIVHEHGGTITLDSAPGRGTNVRVALPLDAED